MTTDNLTPLNPDAIGGIEFAFFRLQPGVSEGDLAAIAHRVDAEFMAGRDGILAHFVVKGDNGLYADVVLADSRERAEQVCALWTEHAATLAFIELLEPESIDMSFWARLKLPA